MTQSTSGLHVALVMDGNGRWATARGRARAVGHRRGAEVVPRIVEAAPGLGISTLTLYAFSADNWKRPEPEVRGLMALFKRFLVRQCAALGTRDVRLTILGRRDRLPPDLRATVTTTERATARNCRLHLRLAVDYSARDAIVEAARRLVEGEHTRADFARRLGEAYGDTAADVDLLIRTGGEQRLSDFLLWECAYAELLFLPKMWPDFGPADLAAALEILARRQRTFGALPPSRNGRGGRRGPPRRFTSRRSRRSGRRRSSSLRSARGCSSVLGPA